MKQNRKKCRALVIKSKIRNYYFKNLKTKDKNILKNASLSGTADLKLILQNILSILRDKKIELNVIETGGSIEVHICTVKKFDIDELNLIAIDFLKCMVLSNLSFSYRFETMDANKFVSYNLLGKDDTVSSTKDIKGATFILIFFKTQDTWYDENKKLSAQEIRDIYDKIDVYKPEEPMVLPIL